MGRYEKLGKNVVLMTIGNFASKIMSFFLIPFYTSILSTSEYGTADLMTTTVSLLMPFFTLLMSEAVMRFTLEQENDKKAVFTNGLAVTLLGISVFLVFSPLSKLSESIGPFYWYFVLYYMVTAIHTLLSYFIRGINKIGIYILSGVLQTLFFLISNIVFLTVIKTGIKGYLLSMIVGHSVAIAILIVGAKLYKYLNLKAFDSRLLHKMLNYSVPMIPNSLSWWISNSSDKYFITLFCDVALTGVYSVSQRIPSLFATISTIFMGAWQISAVEDFGSEQTRKFYSNVYNQYSVLNIIIVSALVTFTKPIAKILFSNDFFAGWYYVPILLFAFLFHAMSSFLGSVYTSAKKTKMLFISTVISAGANIVFNIAMIPIWGALGAAVATFISYFLIWIIRLIDSNKILHMDLKIKRDIVLYILVMIQCIVIMCDMKHTSLAISSLVLMTTSIICKKEIIGIVKQIYKKIGSRLSRN